MKTPVLLTSLLALLVVGCSRHYVREETIVEKQPVVTEKQVVVEKPVVTREIVVEQPVPPLRSCTFASSTFSHGSLSCQNGYQYTCNDGTWIARNFPC